MKVLFPNEECYLMPARAKRYYKRFYRFMIQSLRNAGAEITFTECTSVGQHKFMMTIDDCEVIIDYGDAKTLDESLLSYPYYLKFHYDKRLHAKYNNVYPLTPVSFYDWPAFEELRPTIQYQAKGAAIVNRQRPYGNARERRQKVQNLLSRHFKDRVKTRMVNQVDFWQEINEALVGVFVPGQRIDILDKGQLQYMAFGACTISPELCNTLPFFRDLIPNYHYLQCKPDFSDLTDIIKWCDNHREACKKIGQNAQDLFLTSCTPTKKWQ